MLRLTDAQLAVCIDSCKRICDTVGDDSETTTRFILFVLDAKADDDLRELAPQIERVCSEMKEMDRMIEARFKLLRRERGL